MSTEQVYLCTLVLAFTESLLTNLHWRKLSQIRLATDRSGHNPTKPANEVLIMSSLDRHHGDFPVYFFDVGYQITEEKKLQI